MDLDDLNTRVTEAILRAEGLQAGSVEAKRAFREVGHLEESIARLMPADELEGQIARRGAVNAALGAEEALHALNLLARYLAEDISPEAATSLEALRSKANAVLDE